MRHVAMEIQGLNGNHGAARQGRRGFIGTLIGGGLLTLLGSMLYSVVRYVIPPKVADAGLSSVVAGKVKDFLNAVPTRRRTGRRGASCSCALALAVGFMAVATPALAQMPGLRVPPSLSELQLHHIFGAEEARREVERLHGKGISLVNATVAHYSGGGWDVALHVAAANDSGAAQAQLEEMMARIHSGHGRWTRPPERREDGGTVFAGIERGRVHQAFRRDSRVVCVAADGALARRALADALQYFR